VTRRNESKPRMLRYPRARGRVKRSCSSDQLYLDFDDHDERAILSLGMAPDTVESCFRAGCFAEDEGRFEDAALAYRRALQIGGPRAEVCFNLANSLYAFARVAEAAEHFKQAVALEPQFCEAWNNLGVALAEIGDVKAAEAAFRTSLELDENCADAHYNLADLFDQAEKPTQAGDHWRAYLQLECDGIWAEHARSRLSAPWFPG
jgi:tetratricopeptide (TPR) repeat protein